MKTLNLEQMGVQEMNANELKMTDGGFLLALLVFGIGVLAGYYWMDANAE